MRCGLPGACRRRSDHGGSKLAAHHHAPSAARWNPCTAELATTAVSRHSNGAGVSHTPRSHMRILATQVGSSTDPEGSGCQRRALHLPNGAACCRGCHPDRMESQQQSLARCATFLDGGSGPWSRAPFDCEQVLACRAWLGSRACASATGAAAGGQRAPV